MEFDMSWRTSSQFQKVAWAVDAFQDDANGVAQFAQLCSKELFEDAELVPIFVQDDFETKNAPYHQNATRLLARLGELKSDRIQAPVVLNDVRPPFFSERKIARAFLAHAKAIQADLIICRLNEKAGIEHLIDGTFAEVVVDEAEVPVLLAGPEARLGRVDRVFVPLEFVAEVADGSDLNLALDIARHRGVAIHAYQSAIYGSKQIRVADVLTQLARQSEVPLQVEVVSLGADSYNETLNEGSHDGLIFAASVLPSYDLVQLARKAQVPVLINKPAFQDRSSSLSRKDEELSSGRARSSPS